jgi:N-acetylneuraminate lyase
LVLCGCDSGPFLSRKPMASATPAQIARAREIYARYF